MQLSLDKLHNAISLHGMLQNECIFYDLDDLLLKWLQNHHNCHDMYQDYHEINYYFQVGL
jgi:hypothetical protein